MKIRLSALVICIYCTTLFLACSKTEIAPQEPDTKEQISSKFFDAPSDTDPSIRKVVSRLKEMNSRHEYISSFAKLNGYPVWNKVLAVVAKNQTQSFASSLGKDTVAFIPLVLDNATEVNGFIRVRLSDSIAINYSLAKDYKAYPREVNGIIATADEFALLIMKLNKVVFDYKYFEITDHSLFLDKIDDTTNIASKETRIVLNDSISQGSINSLYTIAQHCEVYTVTICGENAISIGCPRHQETVCWDIMTEIPDGGDSGGGGGGGGGSTGGLPHYYPCPGATTQSSNTPIQPCPAPGPGTG